MQAGQRTKENQLAFAKLYPQNKTRVLVELWFAN